MREQQIKIKLDAVELLIMFMRGNGNSIDTSVTSIKDPSKSSGIMVSEYIKRIRDISELLAKYKELLDKDITDISASKEKIREMDQQMVNLSKGN